MPSPASPCQAPGGICTGGCIGLDGVRNAGVQWVHLLHLDRLRYSHRRGTGDCIFSLCSQECWSTTRSPATRGQASVFAQVVKDCNRKDYSFLGDITKKSKIIIFFSLSLERLSYWLTKAL